MIILICWRLSRERRRNRPEPTVTEPEPTFRVSARLLHNPAWAIREPFPRPFRAHFVSNLGISFCYQPLHANLLYCIILITLYPTLNGCMVPQQRLVYICICNHGQANCLPLQIQICTRARRLWNSLTHHWWRGMWNHVTFRQVCCHVSVRMRWETFLQQQFTFSVHDGSSSGITAW